MVVSLVEMKLDALVQSLILQILRMFNYQQEEQAIWNIFGCTQLKIPINHIPLGLLFPIQIHRNLIQGQLLLLLITQDVQEEVVAPCILVKQIMSKKKFNVVQEMSRMAE